MSKIVEPAPLNGNRVNKELIPLQYKHISNSKIIHNLCTNYKLFIKARIQRFLNQSRVVYLFWESYFPPPSPFWNYIFFQSPRLETGVFDRARGNIRGGRAEEAPLVVFFWILVTNGAFFCARKRSTTNYKVPPKIFFFRHETVIITN